MRTNDPYLGALNDRVPKFDAAATVPALTTVNADAASVTAPRRNQWLGQAQRR